jgi:hypothetical protein
MGAGGWDGWVLRLDSRGNPRWQRTFGGEKDEWLRTAVALPDGGFLLAGATKTIGAGGWNGWVLRVNAEGRLR